MVAARTAPRAGRDARRDPAMTVADPFQLERFVAAQAALYDTVCDELDEGRKRSHWMWFVFPQLLGLGHSATSQRFGIRGLDEARAYLEHPLLGARLHACTQRVLRAGSDPRAIFGSPDDRKFQSSMTLFERAAAEPGDFAAALGRLYGGQRDARTLALLEPHDRR
jgi:uncharacterized protein (DUF1810 family)